MQPTMQEKRHDFLWMVQILMPRDTVKIGWHGAIGDAVAASYRIPAKMTARDAALDFVAFWSEEMRGDAERECPHWMSALRDPNYFEPASA